MVRACLLDQGVAERLQSVAVGELQVGVLLGSFDTASRDYIVSSHPTPPREDESPVIETTAQQQGSKSQSQLQIDNQWVADYAKQLVALCTGGLAVIGLYLLCPEATYTKSLTLACQLLAASRGGGKSAYALLHMDTQSRKVSLKELPGGSSSPAQLKPCEVKQAPVQASLVSLQCRYTPGSTLPIADSLPAGDALKAVVDAECQALASALAVVEGRVLPPSILLQEVSSQLQGPLRIELLPHPASAVPQPLQAQGQGAAVGRALLEGTVVGMAVAHRRDSLAHALRLLKEDLAGTLRQRMHLAVMDAEDGGSSEGPSLAAVLGASVQPLALALPKRVCFPLPGSAALCDHLAPGDEDEQALLTAKELSLPDASPNKLEWPEDHGRPSARAWNPHVLPASASPAPTRVHVPLDADARRDVALHVALAVGILAVIVMLMYIALH